ncbi:beta-phosphoglucomutase family hydrolase [Yamadazyma tenuis]|uniref:HAD-like protein n=1 Tax=Candida tenuis (strain ATCC 10573 / BCRC 21748 / CBS 615 / JCM 9827 / NBRC 10315 / NRRL Y-1498 / VKM Y-70) TaxID=590646 RepID=G3AW10_CANTC|nr:uncharacterized protein CANTEDRAFT_112156 [Yamadazyma tenuis ATCC 10573]XP_006684016.1 HAD-like protein [Yamadazyma tenuis ATCC 10573]EGV66757.1 hypothetical protein CANTEDRAFT_112156 [Yamadazyma tenuis ATCC 10573]EGV66758.1 HAD-like protein [Yamadazyma tenuis ATCC 10573]WEJ95459.1 beta-phosphoglucomutase family hydrolase [Yamadazyma tenuis]
MVPSKFKACLFDMDGTLLNTEDLYTEATSDLFKEFGKGPLTWDVKIKLQGLPGLEATKIIIDHYQLPITAEEFAKKAMEIQATKWHRANYLPGAFEILAHLKQNGIPIALGTSSNKLNFERKTNHLEGFTDFFGDHIVTGDDTRIPKGKGKPEPYIWYVCLGSLNEHRKSQNLEPIKPEECLVFEDGIPGVLSGLAADAHVIWVPHPEAHAYIGPVKEKLAGRKMQILNSLTEFPIERWV